MKRVYNRTDEGGGGGSENVSEDSGAAGGEQGSGANGGQGVVDEDGAGEDEMTFFEEGGGGDGAGDGKGKQASYDFNRFKGVVDDDDITDEEVFTTKVKGLRTENDNLKVLAQGRKLIDEDKEILNYRGLLTQSDDTLAYLSLVQEHMDAGKTKDAAQEAAQQEIDEIKGEEKGAKTIEKMALQTRKFLRGSISERETAIMDKIKAAQKSVDFLSRDEKVIKSAKSEVTKFDSFLGFKLPEAHKGKLVKEVEDFIGSKEEAEAYANPATRARIAMFLKHEKQWTKNVEARKAGAKQQVIKKAISHPRVTGAGAGTKKVVVTAKNKSQGNGRVMNDPAAFLGGGGAKK